ncbi:hypothetical protein BH11PSE13_BH11PSE13_12260 [soil metagenome]
MFDVRRSGPSIDALIADMRDVPERVIPYAAAIALTKAAKRGQKAVIEQMRSSFDSPVSYTLNATRIEIASADNLHARIAVKDQRSGKATRPESYLFPEVEGGRRNFTGTEESLRRSGLLRTGEWAIPQSSSIMDASGNVNGRKVQTILAQLGKQGGSSKYFAGAVGKRGTRGLWERGTAVGGRTGKKQTRSVKALFIFTTRAPAYRPRLDFTGAAAAAVNSAFASDFYAAAQSLRKKFA